MVEKFIERTKRLFPRATQSWWLAHSIRTGVAAAVSLAVAQLCRLHEAYWAPITTLIVMQSTLGAAWTISKKRLVGTALGCALGALLANCFRPGIIVFGLAIVLLGLICGILRLDHTAYRFAGITLAIVLLVVRAQAPWVTGIHRFIEVSLGIVVGLVFAAIWPWREFPDGKNPRKSIS
ncbi:MAG TPA: FUSC family protein [Verrucomicrobiae bacterium]|nr:FUSC family protein [Verrucomicrobiae bacterium]